MSRLDPTIAAAGQFAGPNPLSARECDVLSAAGDGSTVADIARRLLLSEGTVRNYLSSAIGKTRARNRIEAAQATSPEVGSTARAGARCDPKLLLRPLGWRESPEKLMPGR